MAITADLTDPDIVTENTVTWQWSKSTTMDGTYMDIDMATSMTYTPVEADEDYYLKATASYTDGHGSGKMAYEMTESSVVSLFAIDGPASRSYMENGTDAVATYTASGDAATTWTLAGDDAADFTITGGMLRFMSSPNYEMPMDEGMDNVYMVTVKGSDGTNEDTEPVTVTVTNVNEAGTVTLMPTSLVVGSEVTASLTDLDGGRYRDHLAVVQVHDHGRNLYRHRHGNLDGLHPSRSRRRLLPEGDGQLHRRGRYRQDGYLHQPVRRRWRGRRWPSPNVRHQR